MQNKLNYLAVSGAGVSIISLLLSPVMQYFSLLLIGDEKIRHALSAVGQRAAF